MKRIRKSEFGLCDFVDQQFHAFGWEWGLFYSQHLLLNHVKYITVQTVLPYMYFVVILFSSYLTNSVIVNVFTE